MRSSWARVASPRAALYFAPPDLVSLNKIVSDTGLAKELLSILNDSKVKYLVVGGHAVSLHAQPRATKDLDILIKPDAGNAAAVYTALTKFGAPLEGSAPDDFIERSKFFRLGLPPVTVDIPPEISGVDFDGAWQRQVEATIDAGTGMRA